MISNRKTSNSTLVNNVLSATSLSEIKSLVEDYIKQGDTDKGHQGDEVIKRYNDATMDLTNLFNLNLSKEKSENVLAARVYLNSKVLELLS